MFKNVGSIENAGYQQFFFFFSFSKNIFEFIFSCLGKRQEHEKQLLFDKNLILERKK